MGLRDRCFRVLEPTAMVSQVDCEALSRRLSVKSYLTTGRERFNIGVKTEEGQVHYELIGKFQII